MLGITIKWGFLSYWRAMLVFVVPIVLLPIPILGQSKAALASYGVLIMAIFWMTEAVPIPITAFLPVVLYPLFGIQDSDEVAREYLKDSIMVFVGGLLVALAFEYSGLHKRIALRVMLATGASIGMLMLGIMLTTMFLSMWMFNTATTAMMVPIIQAVLFELQKSLEEVFQKENEKSYPKKEREEDEMIANVNVEITKRDSLSVATREAVFDPEPLQKQLTSVAPIEKQGDVQKRSEVVLTDLSSTQQLETATNEKTEGKHNSHKSKSIEEKTEELRETIQKMRTMFLLATCYSSNIGGTGVITGSGTNLVALEFLGNLDPKHHGDYASLTFATWMAFNILPMLINVTIAWVYLQLVFLGIPNKLKFWKKGDELDSSSNAIFNPEMECKIKTMLKEKYQDLGSITTHEIAVGICFLIAVSSWVLHDPKFIPGWSELFHGGPHVSISTATLLIGVLFFIVPRNPEFYQAFRTGDFRNVEVKPLLDWDFVMQRFPWGVVILLGGGYALSKGAKKAGLSVVIGKSLSALSDFPPTAIQIICCALIAGVTEVASNTATASIVIPILLELSKQINIHPLYLTLPATVTCSYAFMLPVATPPNAIVYAAGDMKVIDMVKTGLFMNITCVLVLFATTNFYGNLIFHFSEYNYIP